MHKGLFLHITAKIIYVVSSFLLHYFLGQILTPEIYGIVGTIITIINFGYLFLNNGVRQSISKIIAGNKYDVKDAIKKGLIYEGVIILAIFIATYYGAPLIASLLGDESLVIYIKYSAFILPFTGVYFFELGILNGCRLFVIEALLASVYPLLRLIVIPSSKYFKDAVIGTEFGFLMAAIIIFILASYSVVKKRSKYKNLSAKISHIEYIKSTLGYIILFSISSILMNVDTFILKAFSHNNELVGYYTGAVTFGKAPYFLVSAFYLVALPVVTKYYSEGNIEKVLQSIKDILTILLAAVLPVVVIVGASAKALLTAFYSDQYAIAGISLTYLIFGVFFLGITLMFNMIISSTNRKKFNVFASLITLLVFLVVCPILTLKYSIAGTGFASFIVCLIAMLISIWYTKKILSNFFTRQHFKILLINAFLFIGVNLLFAILPPMSIVFIIGLYILIYLILFEIMHKLRIISLQQVIKSLKKEKIEDEQI